MKRRARQVLKWAAAMATVLLLVAWIGSKWWWWRASRLADGTMHEATLWGGRGTFNRLEPRENTSTPMFRDVPVFSRGTRHDQRFAWWFEYAQYSTPQIFVTSLSIPLWPLILLTGIPAAWMFLTDRKRRRAMREGLCSKCGYDLRGLSAESVCPECGWNRG